MVVFEFVERVERGRRKDLKGGGRLESKGGGREDFRVRKAQESGKRWPRLRGKDEKESTGNREIEDQEVVLLQAESDGAWRVGDTQGKGPAVEVLKFEMRQHKKLLCPFGSGRSSPNISRAVVNWGNYFELL
jgi:hypothetical protein